MAMACFRGVPSFTSSEILSLIFCFRERRTRAFLGAATSHSVAVVTSLGWDTAAEPPAKLQGSLLPVEPVGPALRLCSKLLGGRP